MSTKQSARVGIVTVSDRASRGEYEDLGGPAIREWLDHLPPVSAAAAQELQDVVDAEDFRSIDDAMWQ